MVSREYSRGAGTQHGKEHGNDCRRAVSRQPSRQVKPSTKEFDVDQAGAIHNCLRLALSQDPVQEGFY